MTGSGTDKSDPGRLMRLLWRDAVEHVPQRGPRAALAIDSVIDAGIAIADAEGLDALTIRRLAGALGVSTMSVYTYVSGKAELVPLMLDTLHGRMAHAGYSAPDWRQRLALLAEDNRAFFALHPWAAAVSLARPPLGPGTMAKYERELLAFEGLGLSDPDMDSALTHLLSFVASCARAAAAQQQAELISGIDDQGWWAANAPFFLLAFDRLRFPTAARVGAAAGEAIGGPYDPAHAWTFGLARVLDGFAALIARR